MSLNTPEAWKAINNLRVLCADIVDKANSGHPGAPMDIFSPIEYNCDLTVLRMSPLAYVLFSKYFKANPSHPLWLNRDRFVLSNGHACALQYALLHLMGYKEWTLEDLKQFRQLDSKTAGHPESHFPPIEVCTGPLGQGDAIHMAEGLSSAVGLAIAEAHMRARFNKPGFNVIDHYTYVFCGDGCLQEGITAEASSLAGHLGLGKLIVFYDDNHITIDGSTDLAFTEDVLQRYAAYGWHVQHVQDGNTDLDGIARAIEEAQKVTDRPSIIKVTTTIGYGSKMQGTEHVHGAPLKKDDLAELKKKNGFDPAQSFYISDELRRAFNKVEQGERLEAEWRNMFDNYAAQYPDLAAELNRRVSRQLPRGWESVLPRYTPKDPPQATRKFSQVVINKLAPILPELVGGSADLNPSCFTYMDVSKDFQKGQYEHRNIRFGVREHAMAAIMNGLAAYGTIIPFCSTFFNFIGYALGAVTLTALSGFKVLYIMTHDSIGLGEDGPTHQPVEKLMLCRSTPNLLTLRPADGNETSGAYLAALTANHRPSVIALSRQNVPNLEGSSVEGVLKGAYILQEAPNGGRPDIVLVGTGSEVQLCVEARKKLQGTINARVVSMPSWELFSEQPLEYKESVLPPGVPVLSVEAGTITGWTKFAHAAIGMTTFGASGPLNAVMKKFGFTADNVAEKAKLCVEFYRTNPVPVLLRKPWAHL